MRVLRVQSRRNFCSVLDFLFFFIFLSLFFSFLLFCLFFIFIALFFSRLFCFLFCYLFMLFFEQRRRRLTAKLAAYVRAGVGVCVRVYVRVLVSLCVRVLASDEGSLPLTGTTNCRLNGLSGMQGVCECECLCVGVCLRACVRFPRSRSTKLRNCNSLAVTQLGAYGSSSSLCMRSSRSVCVCV